MTWRVRYYLSLYPLYDHVACHFTGYRRSMRVRRLAGKFIKHINDVWDSMSAEEHKYIYLRGKQ